MFRSALALVAQETTLDEPAPPTGGYGWQIARTLIVLALLCVGAWWLLRVLARRNGLPSGTTKHLRVIEQHALDPRKKIVLVQLGSQVLLLGASDETITVLKELPAQDLGIEPQSTQTTPDTQTATGRHFRNLIERFTNTQKSAHKEPVDEVTTVSPEG